MKNNIKCITSAHKLTNNNVDKAHDIGHDLSNKLLDKLEELFHGVNDKDKHDCSQIVVIEAVMAYFVASLIGGLVARNKSSKSSKKVYLNSLIQNVNNFLDNHEHSN